MLKMDLQKWAAILGLRYEGPAADVTGFCTDTRALQPGNVFIALRGEQFDGHDFISQAAEKGAIAALVEKPVSGCSLPQLSVPNTRTAFLQLAHAYREIFDLPIIALTGSNGKTSVKEMLASLLRTQHPVLATEGNYNNDIGVPLTLFRLTPEHEVAVIELGMNHPGEIAVLADCVKPTVALVTNVGPAHIGQFPDLAAIGAEKGSIYQSLSPEGIAVVNIDCEFHPTWAIPAKTVYRVSRHQPADFTVSDVAVGPGGSAFTLHTPIGSIPVRFPLLGEHHIMNALLATAAAVAVGVKDLKQIALTLSQHRAVKGRMEPVAGYNDSCLINDSYNANPVSMEMGLRYLAQCEGLRYFIVGDMGELGALAPHYHTELGNLAKSLHIDQVFAVGHHTPYLCEAFGEGAFHFQDKTSLVEAVKPLLNSRVTCLVKGSRSQGLETVIAALKG